MIEPTEVLKAFEDRDLVPAQGVWVESKLGKTCACGLTALALSCDLAFMHVFLSNDKEHTVFEYLKLKKDLTTLYLEWFVAGFDGTFVPYESIYNNARFSREGFEAGKAAWEAVKHLRK